MDPSASEQPSSTMLDAAIRIGLVAVLVYACGRIVLPFAGILAWSAILAVMLYPLHLRLATWLGNRWSALLIGLIGVAAALGPMVIVVTSLATSLGYFAIGLEAAGLLTMAALLLGIMQVPLILLTLPVVGYVFATEAPQPAILFLIWNVVVGLSDNVLRPLLLGRGLEVPMPVILIGVIGGMLVDGLLGLFVGPVLLAVSYVLLLEWLRQHPIDGGPQIDARRNANPRRQSR